MKRRSCSGIAAAFVLALAVPLVHQALLPSPAEAAAAPRPEAQNWAHTGIFGTFDRHQLQRGFQVYREVCAVCHSMDYLHYRNLSALGYSEQQVAEFAAEAMVLDGPDEFGEMFERPGLPSDRFQPPFPNQNAARAANNNAYPPDLTVFTKSRPHGLDYTFALLTGYVDPPAGADIPDGMVYNAAYGGPIAMMPPLMEGVIEFADGTPATVEQMARDVTVFMAWAAEPELEERKRLGVKVMLFLLLLTAVLYALKRKIWADLR